MFYPKNWDRVVYQAPIKGPSLPHQTFLIISWCSCNVQLDLDSQVPQLSTIEFCRLHLSWWTQKEPPADWNLTLGIPNACAETLSHTTTGGAISPRLPPGVALASRYSKETAKELEKELVLGLHEENLQSTGHGSRLQVSFSVALPTLLWLCFLCIARGLWLGGIHPSFQMFNQWVQGTQGRPPFFSCCLAERTLEP